MELKNVSSPSNVLATDEQIEIGVNTMAFLVCILASLPIVQNNTIDPIIAFAGVVTTQGQPVPGATVWLMGGGETYFGDNDSKILTSALTDQQGKFRLPYVKGEPLQVIFVKAKDGRLNVIRIFETFDDPLQLTCELPAGKPYHAKLVDQTGRGWAKAKVSLLWLYGGKREIVNGQPVTNSQLHNVEVPQALHELMTVETDDQGMFTLPNIPQPGLLRLRLKLKPQYEVEIKCDSMRDKEIVIEQPGKLAVTFNGVDDVAMLKGSEWYALSRNSDDVQQRYRLTIKLMVHPGTQEMIFEGLCPGDVDIRSDESKPSTSAFILKKNVQPKVSIKSGETSSIQVPLLRGIQITGKVVDSQTKEGIAGVKVDIRSRKPNDARMPRSFRTMTLPNGTFSRYVTPGEISCWVFGNIPAKGYSGIFHYESHSKRHELTNGQTVWPDIELHRSISLKGRVVNNQGKPVPGARVYTTQNYLHAQHNYPMTDHQGRFQINNLRKEQLELYVRSPQGVSRKLTIVDLSQPIDEVLLTVDSSEECYFTGQLIDKQGNPITNHSLQLRVPLRDLPNSDARQGLNFKLKPTDAQGRFHFGPYWPNQKYVLHSWLVEQQAEFQHVIPVTHSGATTDLGKIALEVPARK